MEKSFQEEVDQEQAKLANAQAELAFRQDKDAALAVAGNVDREGILRGGFVARRQGRRQRARASSSAAHAHARGRGR